MASPHQTFFIEFLQRSSISDKEYELDVDVGMFLLPFLRLKPMKPIENSEQSSSANKPINLVMQTNNTNAS